MSVPPGIPFEMSPEAEFSMHYALLAHRAKTASENSHVQKCLSAVTEYVSVGRIDHAELAEVTEQTRSTLQNLENTQEFFELNGRLLSHEQSCLLRSMRLASMLFEAIDLRQKEGTPLPPATRKELLRIKGVLHLASAPCVS